MINESLRINGVTLQDKIRTLLEQPYKLVLVQRHELERLRLNNKRSEHAAYIDYLYYHYIVNKKPKTYIKQ